MDTERDRPQCRSAHHEACHICGSASHNDLCYIEMKQVGESFLRLWESELARAKEARGGD